MLATYINIKWLLLYCLHSLVYHPIKLHYFGCQTTDRWERVTKECQVYSIAISLVFISWVCCLYISVDIDTLFKESDFVSAHTALTPETAGKIYSVWAFIKNLLEHAFPSATCVYYGFWLVHWLTWDLCDWPEWLLWFWREKISWREMASHTSSEAFVCGKVKSIVFGLDATFQFFSIYRNVQQECFLQDEE